MRTLVTAVAESLLSDGPVCYLVSLDGPCLLNRLLNNASLKESRAWRMQIWHGDAARPRWREAPPAPAHPAEEARGGLVERDGEDSGDGGKAARRAEQRAYQEGTTAEEFFGGRELFKVPETHQQQQAEEVPEEVKYLETQGFPGVDRVLGDESGGVEQQEAVDGGSVESAVYGDVQEGYSAEATVDGKRARRLLGLVGVG